MSLNFIVNIHRYLLQRRNAIAHVRDRPVVLALQAINLRARIPTPTTAISARAPVRQSPPFVHHHAHHGVITRRHATHAHTHTHRTHTNQNHHAHPRHGPRCECQRTPAPSSIVVVVTPTRARTWYNSSSPRRRVAPRRRHHVGVTTSLCRHPVPRRAETWWCVPGYMHSTTRRTPLRRAPVARASTGDDDDDQGWWWWW